MNLLSDIITYVRRIIKSPSDAVITDNLIIDYINRFWLMDMSARVQLFDFKTNYQFQTSPGINKYNMPLYDVQTEPGSQTIASFPVYQGFEDPVFVNGIRAAFYTQQNPFYNLFPSYVQSQPVVGTGDGSTTSFTLSLPYAPALTGHIDITGIVATGSNIDPIVGTTFNNDVPQSSIKSGVFFTATAANGSTMVVADSGQFLSTNRTLGLLYQPGTNPFGYTDYNSYSSTSNVVDYANGTAYVNFPSAPADGTDIQAQCYYFQQGIPRAVLFFNNTLTIFPPPNIPYLISLTAYLSPAAFLTTSQAMPFGYMSEYIARGAAQKILSDTGDVEQFSFYEPLFRQQEILVWKRSQRIFTATRTETIFSNASLPFTGNNIGQGT